MTNTHYLYFSLPLLIVAAALFIWAWRRGQFKDQQRARYLPLENRVSAEGSQRSQAARPMGPMVVLAILAAVVLAAGIFLAVLAV
jgi:nitrogen fixation-related uncharacterized protein